MPGACRQAYPEIKSPRLINYKGGKDGKDAMEAFGSKSQGNQHVPVHDPGQPEVQ
jgi:hypothetical protein